MCENFRLSFVFLDTILIGTFLKMNFFDVHDCGKQFICISLLSENNFGGIVIDIFCDINIIDNCV